MNRIGLMILALFFSMYLNISQQMNQYQFIYESRDGWYYVSYSKVEVFDTDSKRVFEGLTDKFGRIAVNLSNSHYKGQVHYSDTLWTVQLNVDGTGGLNKIYINK